MKNFRGILPGIAVIILIMIVSFFLSSLHQSFDMLIISIILGMVLGNFTKNILILSDGISFSLKIFLPIGIALYGTQLTFTGVETKQFPYVVLIFFMLFSFVYFFSKKLGFSKNISILLSTGISVCGSSAITVISPLIDAKKEETSLSVFVILIVGLAGMIFYPILNGIIMFDKNEFAFLTGTTLPTIGQVKTTALTAGQDVLSYALKLKLIRVSFLIFLPLIVLWLKGKEKKFYFPWFIIVFIMLAIIANIVNNQHYIFQIAESLSKFFLSGALAAIGFSVNFNSLFDEIKKAFIATFIPWSLIVLAICLTLIFSN
ncbi:MAG: putative sulfate exporter family transporter [Nitrospiraceae bacterium]|nr:putative sulfate exporter family transporter [Nitrospiraceae bacterium]